MSSVAESVKSLNISATTAAFKLKGGKYGMTAIATFGGGSIQLQILAFDGTTFINVGSAITAAGFVNFDLPPGQYRLAITTATAVYTSLTSVPY